MSVTIKDIALLAGVSSSTVSMVIHGKKGVGEETRQRIIDILDQQHYFPKKKNNKTNKKIYILKHANHGMIVEENQGFVLSIIENIINYLHDLDFFVSQIACDNKTYEQAISRINVEEPTGVIIIGSELSPEQVDYAEKIYSPKVIVDNSAFDRQIDSVVMANEEIAYECIKYLNYLGHREIGLLNSNAMIGNFFERELGYHRAIEELGLKEGKAFSLTPSMNGVYEDMLEQLKNERKLPSAFFAQNDWVAIGAIKALQDVGYRIPEDISIIGVDDIPISSIWHPSLSTIHISRSFIAKCAVDLLLGRIDYPTQPVVHLKIMGNLVIRHSTSEYRKAVQ